MSPDHALALMQALLQVTIVVVGPLLGAALLAGVSVGVVQTATQVNEASLGFIVKVMAALVALLLFGPMMAEKLVSYTRECFEGVAGVVR
jgi:flagellar biosynthetic protein FliQ